MVQKPDKDAEQDNQGVVQEISDFRSREDLKQENEFLKRQNESLDRQLQEKIDKLRKMQVATYKIATTKQYQLIEKESENVETRLNPGALKPPDFFYFPKIGMRLCQCDDCKKEAVSYKGHKSTHGENDKRLYWLTGIGHFEGHSGFDEANARYLCEFLNKHPEFMHKLENLDKDRYE